MNRLRVLTQMNKAINLLNNSVSLQQNSVRTAFVYTPDWLPGNRPKTEEDRLKAAKKYNLLPEEYTPAPDDGYATGDYPHLPSVHYDNKDPFYPYDYPLFRHNYGEAFPDDFAITLGVHYNEDSPVSRRFSVWEQMYMCFGVFGTVGLILYFFGIKYRYYYPKFDTPLYKKGVVHYGYAK